MIYLMKRNVSLLATLVAHTLFGSFCTMSVANAMPIENQAEMHSQVSHEHCDQCTHEKHESKESMSCNSGDCFVAPSSENSLPSNTKIELRSHQTSNTFLSIEFTKALHQWHTDYFIDNFLFEIGIHTIVLRQ